MSSVPLDSVVIPQEENHPVTESVKLHGPPGTGKTTTSAARVAKLIRDHGYDIQDVAWATYRRSLAEDTLKRLAEWGVVNEKQLRNPDEGATRYIATTHAIANRCSSTSGNPVEKWQRNHFCQEKLGIPFYGGAPWDDTAGELLFKVFDWMKNNRLDPSVEDDAPDCPFYRDLQMEWPGGHLPDAWESWCEYKDKHDIIDFHEMLRAPLEQDTYPTSHVLVVDEYHDATPLMAHVCEHWMMYADIVIVAADPDQVVNAYDGASPRFYEKLGYPEVLLDTTYRVPEKHWKLATAMLGESPNHSAPPVNRPNGDGSVVQHRSPTFSYDSSRGWTFPSAETESSPPYIHENYTEEDEKTMFLARTKRQCDGICRALEEAGYLYHSQQKLPGWNQTGNKELKDRRRLYNALSALDGFEGHHIDDTEIELYDGQQMLGTFDDSVEDERPRDPRKTTLSPGTAATFLEYVNAQYLEETRNKTDDICNSIRYQKGAFTLTSFTEHVTDEFWNVYTNGSSSVSKLNSGDVGGRQRHALVNALKRHGNGHQIGDSGTDPLSVMTIHGAKGNEAENVAVYDGITSSIQNGMAEREQTRDNEFRTWFVALTRASKTLHVVGDGFNWMAPFIGDHL